MKKFIVQYEKVSYYVIEVEANSRYEANEKAANSDESEFTQTEDSGHWMHEDTTEIKY